MHATIWHNPDCGTSRKTLAILQESEGVEVSVIEYRKQPFTRPKLEQLFQDAGLTPREAKVLRMRFGIEMSTDHTLEEVGKQFDVTRERIRQIEAKALRKLKHPSRSDKLRSFIDMN